MRRPRPGLSLEEDQSRYPPKVPQEAGKKVDHMDFGWLFIVVGVIITLFMAAEVLSWNLSRW